MTGRGTGFASAASGALVLCAFGACAGSSAGTSAFEARVASPEGSRARTLAADLFARADEAREVARAAGDPAAVHDHDERALLLLEAAITEADRIVLDERRAGIELRVERATAALAQAELARATLVRRIERAEAARIARREAERVLAQADVDESRRLPKDERDRLHREAASALRRRAALVLAAATALGVDPALREDAQGMLGAALDAATKKGGATEELVLARRALEGAERTLGQARNSAPAPSPEETASLVAAAAERGITVERLERGIALRLADAFASGSARATPAGLRAIEQLAALVRAHPHGPVTIEAYAEGAGAAAARVAAARARRVAAGLAEATDRVRVEAGTHGAEADGVVQVVFGAYAELPAPAAQ